MVKMKDRNAMLKTALGGMATKERVVEAASVPQEDTVNIEGRKAYSLPEELKLVTMLNTLKLEPQFYRSVGKQMKDIRDTVEKVGLKDPYFLAQAIVYSRCMGEGMRSINHLAAALASPFISGTEYSKRFYGAFDKKNKKGGCIFRPDDMSEIKDVWAALNPKGDGSRKAKALPNAMKKGFASTLLNMDTYQLAKYPKTAIDIANLVHPNVQNAVATIKVEGETMKTLDALMKGVKVTADTWETAQSEAGQEVAKAVREGKLTKKEAEAVLSEAKNDNWETLLKDGKLGVMAALRNIRNMMKNPRKEVIDALCKLITDSKKIRQALILPCHFDLAYEVVMDEFAQADYSAKVQQALLDGYEASIPNLKDALPGRTLVVVDCSGSMGGMTISTKDKAGESYYWGYTGSRRETKTCAYKAGLIAATIAKATNADVIKFGDYAHYFNYAKNLNVFALAKTIGTHTDGSTRPHYAFELIAKQHEAYDRIIFISDNAVNGNNLTSDSYRRYIHDVCSPYIYAIDLAAYGTTPLKNDGKVNYYYGYGSALYEDIASREFNPEAHMDKIRAIEI